METKVPLVCENYYNFYSRKNKGITIFFYTNRYFYFLALFAKYIELITETHAWFLLKQHLHNAELIKEKKEIKLSDLGYKTTEKSKNIERHKGFDHLYTTYIESLNKKRSRHRNLVKTKLKKKIISFKNHSQQLLFYIQNNLRFKKQRNVGKAITIGKLKVVNYMKINIAIKWVE